VDELKNGHSHSSQPVRRTSSERDEIVRVLREAKGQVGGPNGAAARLGLKRTTLISRMKKFGINISSRQVS
jgi:formate hydrogenlyase transcriptional activator